jgi:hypothetical protein
MAKENDILKKQLAVQRQDPQHFATTEHVSHNHLNNLIKNIQNIVGKIENIQDPKAKTQSFGKGDTPSFKYRTK